MNKGAKRARHIRGRVAMRTDAQEARQAAVEPNPYFKIRVWFQGTFWWAQVEHFDECGHDECAMAIRTAVTVADASCGGPGCANISPRLRAALAAETLKQPMV